MTFGLQTERDESFAIMDAAAEHGVDFFDVADVYPVGGTLATVGRPEEFVGDWLSGKREREASRHQTGVRHALATACDRWRRSRKTSRLERPSRGRS
jgi:aryl-alcohol dehydrogenase-like predicted oxidoreductase